MESMKKIDELFEKDMSNFMNNSIPRNDRRRVLNFKLLWSPDADEDMIEPNKHALISHEEYRRLYFLARDFMYCKLESDWKEFLEYYNHLSSRKCCCNV